MANVLVCGAVFRIVLPLVMLSCIIFRPSVLSGIYLFLLLVSASVPIPNKDTMSGLTGIFLKILIVISTLTSFASLIFQIVLIAQYQYDLHSQNCENPEMLLRHIGLIKLDHLPEIDVIVFITPELVMFVTSIAFYVIFGKLTKPPPPVMQEDGLPQRVGSAHGIDSKQKNKLLLTLGKCAVVQLLCGAAIIQPSIQGGFYFLVYLSSSTWWAFNRNLGKGFAIVLKFCMLVVFVHIFTIYAYQTQWVQEIIPDNEVRYLRLTAFMSMNCTEPRHFEYHAADAPNYINVFLLMILYFFMATVSRELLEPQDYSFRMNGNNSSEITPLMHTSGSTPRYGTGTRGPTVLQDSTGSVIISSDNPDDIPLKDVPGSDLEEEVAPSLFERLVFVFESILIFVIRTSYIATNIIMMTWSITYHSWLTFVLLLWANIIWMIPHQRQNMLRSSPFLVLYASLLLIASYIYDMDLTDAEIPSKIFNIPLKELGLDKSNNDPSILLVKCLFTSMFWITLRQYMKETRDARNSSVLNDIVAPLEVTVGAAAGISQMARLFTDGHRGKQRVYPKKRLSDPVSHLSICQNQHEIDSNLTSEHPAIGSDMSGVLDPDSEKKGGEMFRKIGEFISQLLTKLWIWIVAITLFLVAITGDRMTGFRILYMALFIIFMLSFQLSFRVWRKMMFGFWLTVIVYSMLVLIMVYTYQFDHFNDYWKKYLHVDYQQQLDIGLEKYETKQLFVRLVTPTVFVIITVIQLHYFHKDFMEMSKPKFGNVTFDTSKSEANSSAQGGLKTMEEDADEEDEESSETTDIENISTKIVRRNLYKLKELLIKFINFLMCYLEIHMQKLVLFVAMLISVMNPCAIYLWIIILVVLGTTIGKTMVDVSIYIISVTSSLLLLTRMLYQIEYIDHNRWNVSCPVKISNGSTIDYDYNDAQWIGLKKIEPGERLIDLVKWDIVYMVTISLWCTLKIRQINYRADRGDYLRRPFFVFPNVKIQDANKSLKNYLKYLVNYFYFRTGVEVSLIALVITIGIHMDFYAIIYAIWLCILFLMRRKTLSRIWNVFVMFTAILIPIQYFIVIGFPPALCFVDFQWTSDVYMQRLQAWVYYNIYYFQPSSARKLLSDFILLLLIARQSLVFRIEARHGSSYIGGNNDIIIHHAEEKDFVNPVPDFITYSRTYLDVLKKATILPFIWITFAVVFLAGANRVNIFSIGYLLGTFHFLWEGSDIYLRPIPLIIKKWNILLSYNVAVISFKVVFQLFGCVFYQYMEENLCVLVQLFGIGCLSKNPELMINIDQEECAVTIENVDVSWDAACFAFLIIQKRIFHSYNFFHLINENKASTILACRGAELIEELRCKRVLEQEETERNVIEKIKLKMDRIKASQQKILGPGSEQGDHKVVRSGSVSSCASATSGASSQQTATPAGYHTPIEDGDGDDGDDERSDLPPLTPATGSVLQPNAPSPFSAIMTGSLEAYLEPQLMSFSSPPNSELNPARPPSPEESFPVFSPPPYDEAPPYAEVTSELTTVVQKQHSLGPPWMAGSLVTPRQSVFSYSSRSPMSHHTYTIYPKSSRPMYRRKEPKSYKAAIRSGDYYMFDDIENEKLDFYDDVPIDEEDEYSKATRGPTLGELITSTMKTDLPTVLRSTLKRRVSVPPVKREPAESQISAPLSAPPTVRIREIEPQPSTSREDDKRSIITVEKKKPRKFQKVLDYLLFLCTIVEGAMLSAINFMNRFSKDYKYVLRVLSREKKILKESTDYNIGVRMGPNSIWQPAANYKTLITSQTTELLSTTSEKQLNSEESVTKDIATSPLAYSTEKDSISEEDYNIDDITSGHDQLTVIRLIMAAWYIVLTYSDLICYFVIFLNQIKNATLMSLPLPLLVFFWGTLTVPRPSKTFWVTIIAYTQIIVIIKCVCQFSILPWNQPNYVRSFDFSGFIGVEKRNNYAIWDLLLLLVVHLHRFLLTCLGLWKNSYDTVAVLAEGRFESAAEEEESQREDIDVYHSDTRQLVENSDNEDTPVQTSEVEAKKLFPASVSLILQKHVDQLKQFFDKLVDPTSRLADDVYSYMFICDFFNFFVILMGYSSFGSQQEDGGVSSYLEENRVPMLFLLLLIVQFLLIIIDRAIFLRKNLLAKIVFQIFQIISLHIWLFMIFPAVTERRVNTVVPPQMLYMVKCFYLLLSAYQIRSGYPARILGNFLCKGYGYVNMFLFKSFMLIPFLFELRTVMDWMWTDTSMTIFDWIKMEDIFVHIYQLKCSRHIEDEYPQPRGEKKKPTVKYMMGGAALAIIVILIWFPLVFFSLSNAVGKPNMPFDVTINLRLGPYEPLYRMSAQKNSIYQLNENEYHRLTTHYNKNKAASTFLSFYDYNDIGAVKLNPGSATVWNISPPDKNRMILEVESNNTVFLHLQYEVSHETSSKEELSVLQDEVVVEVEAFIDGKVNPVRQNILSMLKGEKAEPTLLQYIMPKFIKVTNRGVIQVMNQLMNPVPDKRAQQYRNITIELSQETDSDKVWWQIKEECDDDNYKKHLQWIAFADCAYLMIYTFNDKVFPSTLSFISGGGIIGLYTTLVFVASRVLRGFFSEICFKIMFDDMPYVDRVFQLCLDVYLVREAGEFALEEDLFAKLVFLYRSPETLIKWTRPQEEVDDDENPEGDEN